MRSARAEDHWRHATSKSRGFGLRSARIEGKAPLGHVEIDFANGLTVICGLNGVGKSTLLRVVEAALNGSRSVEPRTRTDLLSAGTAEFLLEIDNADATAIVGVDRSDQPGRAVLLDAFDACSQLLSLRNEKNFADLVDVVEPREWGDEERQQVGFVVGRTYDSILVYEIENPTSIEEGFGDEALPYFKVRANGVEYDSFAMGTGELAALSVLWRLWSVESQTVLTIEEPETFLSSRSTVALLDVVAQAVDQLRLYAIVTTHSPHVVARAPIQNVRLIRPELGTPHVVVETPISRAQLEHSLGSMVGVPRLVYVEDPTAECLTTELLAVFAGPWGEGVNVQPAGGEDRVRSICSTLPRSDQIRVVGVLDGDQELPPADPDSWPLLLLPGGTDPDSALRSAALNEQASFAAELHREEAALAGALAVVGGADPHDWFPDLAATLNVPLTAVLRAAIHCWLADPEVEETCNEFAGQLADALSG